MTILGLAESFKMMNRSDLNRPRDYEREGCEILTHLHSNLQFMLLKFGIDIFNRLETMHFSAT